MTNKTIQLTLLFLFATFFANAQSAEVGAYLGGINSFNDLNTNTKFNTLRPAGGVLGKYNFNNRVGVELMAGYGTSFSKDAAYNEDAFQRARNAASKTRTVDVQLAGEFNFFPFGDGSPFTQSRTKDYTPYLTAGIGLTNMRALVYSRFTKDFVTAPSVNAELNEEFKQLLINIPLGAGVKYKLNEQFHLAAEFGTRILFNDYYDGFSTRYTQVGVDSNPGSLTNVGIQRGDRSRNDVYNILSAQMTYVIPFNKCW